MTFIFCNPNSCQGREGYADARVEGKKIDNNRDMDELLK